MNIISIMAYDNTERVLRTVDEVERIRERYPHAELQVNLFFLGYPLNNDAAKIWFRCFQLGFGCFATENLGQDGNINAIGQAAKDINYNTMLFFDPDFRPNNYYFLNDALRVFRADDKCDFVTMNCSQTDNALAWQQPIQTLAGVQVAKLNITGGLPVFMFRKRFLDEGYKKTHLYGGSEGNIMTAIYERGRTGYMLADYDDLRALEGIDPEYTEWKRYAIDKPDAIDFKEWLRCRPS